ncbi:cytokinin dehydrogenase 5-like [Zingiber officinale]|uniref:cytokinin dehydrogenase n=1 Tax=Zingiber officinale TaxID=94328 RepID=A0A8J5GN49_ZINOF|nr:cytokinin dehydrogenase 5-like [Zingiber officinale]KAG6507370.1 hypothetical protein ZIOFF_032712 [Zingiber officinale]
MAIERHALLLLLICRLLATVGLTVAPAEPLLQLFDSDVVRLDPPALAASSSDFGALFTAAPTAVARPRSAEDVAGLIRSAHAAGSFPVSARGCGHSTHGQALAPAGLVVEMARGRLPGHRPTPVYAGGQHYVDVWGGDSWTDVLSWTLSHGGLAPKSWTDYLHLSVGGTLSNAGVSGQAFHHGPQISNVLQLDVVTGEGEVVTCSNEENSELFNAVLGGLGQFGIITRARIALERAPQRARWIRVLYSDFAAFTRDQERLIALDGERFDYVEGLVIVDEGLINNWRSSFFSPKNPVKIGSVAGEQRVLYCLEMAKYYHEEDGGEVDGAVERLLRRLRYIPSTEFTTDLTYVEFLGRVHRAEERLRSKGLWDVPHPWLNLFVPASQIADFDSGVFRGILGNNTGGPVLIYPMNKNKWDERSSAVMPEEDVFYLVAFLRSALPNSDDPTQSLEHLKQQNREILEFCHRAHIKIKQYLPHYKTQGEWVDHFGPKWNRFVARKVEFDPKHILGSGHGIFHPSSSPSSLFHT